MPVLFLLLTACQLTASAGCRIVGYMDFFCLLVYKI